MDREYKALSVKEAAEILLGIEKPVIMMHRRPDGDTVGSCAALARAYMQLGKKPSYFCADEIPMRLKFLLDGIERADAPSPDETVTVDIATESQMGGVGMTLSPVIMIDHHAVGTPFADNFIIREMSSCAEVILEILLYLKEEMGFVVTRDVAYPLYAGISSDTGSFRYSNTTPETLRRCATLMDTGIDFSEINHKLFSSKTEKEIRAEGIVSGKIQTAFGGRISYAVITARDCMAIGGDMSDFECAVDITRSLMGAEITFVVKELSEGENRVSLRSTGRDVSLVAKQFGGGGHIRASGCTVMAKSPDEACDTVIEILKDLFYKNEEN